MLSSCHLDAMRRSDLPLPESQLWHEGDETIGILLMNPLCTTCRVVINLSRKVKVELGGKNAFRENAEEGCCFNSERQT